MKKFLKDFFDPSMIRFIIVGVINTIFGTAIMFGLYNLAGCEYWVSTAANYILASILSYFLNKYFTFRNRERSFVQVIKFAVNIAVCYLIAYKLAREAVYSIMANSTETAKDNVAMLVGMVLFTGLNYLGQRFFAFRKTKTADDRPEETDEQGKK